MRQTCCPHPAISGRKPTPRYSYHPYLGLHVWSPVQLFVPGSSIQVEVPRPSLSLSPYLEKSSGCSPLQQCEIPHPSSSLPRGPEGLALLPWFSSSVRTLHFVSQVCGAHSDLKDHQPCCFFELHLCLFSTSLLNWLQCWTETLGCCCFPLSMLSSRMLYAVALRKTL